MTIDVCTECGFEYDLTMAPTAGRSIVDGAGELAAVLTSTHQDLRARWQPTTWSPLEYACHLRDVFLVQRERVLLARRVDRPALEPMGRDERVESATTSWTSAVNLNSAHNANYL